MMHNPSKVKQKILKKFIMGLRSCNSSHENLSVSERRRIIKLSADLALASVRNGSRRWSRAIIEEASRSPDNKGLVQQMLGSDGDNHLPGPIPWEGRSDRNGAGHVTKSKSVVAASSKKIVKRCRRVRRSNGRAPRRNEAASIAKRLVKKRTQLLKDFVPGGRDMDDVSLIEETLDYMVWLRAQVDVMRALACSLPTTSS
ncbi:hypothetical protein MLD38_014504 [Melastoma candidum]|uniref:Uncharacterized protein n=1 Tax=Melastoma candidum TaxID=119954 RepID=A0ACB9RCD5_9MYRT|nr:hypothetical protein MLD38_014504 [Melastoma candidum]